MQWLDQLALRFRSLFRRDRVEQELDDELRFHLERQIEANVKAGMTPEEARYAALRQFGGVEQIKEECREARGVRYIEELVQDLRYGLRQLRRNPGFTAVAVITLALGIGANTAIFSVVHAVLLRPLPYADPDRLVIVWEENPSRGWITNIASPANFNDWRKQNNVFTDMAAVDPTSFNLSGEGKPVEVGGEQVTANLFTLLGVQPIRGRGFLPEDDRPGSTPVALLSYGLWQSRYGGDVAIVGKQISLDGRSHQVVGIMPPNFSDLYTTFFKTNAQVWVTGLDLSEPSHTSHMYLVLARLKPRLTLAQAQHEMDTIASRIVMQFPESKGWGVRVIRVHDQVVGYARHDLRVLMAAVAFVLLMACVNLANLLLCRSASREKEVAIRTALGANRGRVVRQLLTESLLLAIAGGMAGVGLAYLGIDSLLALAPADMPGLNIDSLLANASISLPVLSFAILVTVATGFLFGLVPALGMSKPDVNASLKESGRGSTEGARGRRLRGFLVAGEFALAFVLVIGAGLMIRTLVHLTHFSLGFNPDNVLTLRLPLRGARYEDPRRQAEFFQQLLTQVETLPEVQCASVSRGLPIEGQNGMDFVTEDNPNPAPGQVPAANYLVIGPHYFRTLGIPLRAGREFADNDNQSTQQVVVVNEELVRSNWPGQNPLGKRLRTGTGKRPWLTVVGVVANIRTQGPDVGFEPELYIPYTQYPWMLSPRHLVVRTTGNPLAIAPAIRRAVAALDAEVPVSDIRPLDQIAGQPVAPRRFVMVLLGFFAALALVLAGVGIYGVMAYSVSQRTHEIGIRMALGARQSDILRGVVRQGLTLALLGAGTGLAGALILSRFIASLLFHVQPSDPATFAGVTLLLIAVGLFACYIPARRAAKVDPMVALRYE